MFLLLLHFTPFSKNKQIASFSDIPYQSELFTSSLILLIKSIGFSSLFYLTLKSSALLSFIENLFFAIVFTINVKSCKVACSLNDQPSNIFCQKLSTLLFATSNIKSPGVSPDLTYVEKRLKNILVSMKFVLTVRGGVSVLVLICFL